MNSTTLLGIPHRVLLAALSLCVVLVTGCGASSKFKAIHEKAVKGDAQAQLELGQMFLAGTEVKQSDSEGAKWCQQAAAKGLPAAQRFYGMMLLAGGAVPRNLAQGRVWLEKAANQGDVAAQIELATMLGLFSPPFDYAEAMKWLLISEKNGSTNAPALIKLISEQISPAELAQAREKAAAFGTEK